MQIPHHCIQFRHGIRYRSPRSEYHAPPAGDLIQVPALCKHIRGFLCICLSNKCLGTGIIKNRKYFADKLGLSEEDEIYGIHRIRLGNKEPLAIEFTYVPLHFFSDIDNYNFEHISLYDYMKSKNHLPVKFNETMMMVEAGEKLQKHLHLPSATSIVNYIEFIGYDENGNLVEYTESYSRPDKLEVRFVTNDI